MIKKIFIFILCINIVFAQEKISWLLSNQNNITKLDSDISTVFSSEFQKMENNYKKLYEQYLWNETSSGKKSIKFKTPVIVKQFTPTWKDILEAYGGYSGASDAGITKDDLSKLTITIMVTSLNLTSNKDVHVELQVSGEDEAIEFYDIENIRREYMGKYSLPNMDAQNLYNYGEKVKKNENQMPYLTIKLADRGLKYTIRNRSYQYNKEGTDTLLKDINLEISLDKISPDFRKKLTTSHDVMIQIVTDLITDEYYESLYHRVEVRRKKAETKRRVEAEKAEAKKREAEAEKLANLKKANSEFDERFDNHALSMTHSFFLNPSDKREKLIDDYLDVSNRINRLKIPRSNSDINSFEDFLRKKGDLYQSLLDDYNQHVVNENFSDFEKQYVNYLQNREKYPDGKKFYDQLEFASKVTDDLVMIMISYLNKPKDDRINVINEYLYFIMVQSKNQTPSENKKSHQDLRKKSQPFIDECCSTKPYKYTKTNTRHIFKHSNAKNGFQAKVAKKDTWESSPYFLTHGFMRFLIGDAEYYRKEIGNDKREDAYRELARNFEEVNLEIPLYFQLQQQEYNRDVIQDTHRWLKKKFDRYGDKGGSDKGNGLQYLYGAIVEMADVDLENITKEDSNYYNIWYNSSTFSSKEYTRLRLSQMNVLYKFYFGID